MIRRPLSGRKFPPTHFERYDEPLAHGRCSFSILTSSGVHDIIFAMRTTLTLDDDVLAEANRRAAALRISLGKALSDLARRGIQSAPPVEEVHGLAVFTPPKGSPRITARKIKEILSDFP